MNIWKTKELTQFIVWWCQKGQIRHIVSSRGSLLLLVIRAHMQMYQNKNSPAKCIKILKITCEDILSEVEYQRSYFLFFLKYIQRISRHNRVQMAIFCAQIWFIFTYHLCFFSFFFFFFWVVQFESWYVWKMFLLVIFFFTSNKPSIQVFVVLLKLLNNLALYQVPALPCQACGCYIFVI